MTLLTQADPEPPTEPATSGFQYRWAYQQTASERAALAAEQVLVVNANVPSVVHIALVAVRQLAELRPRMTSLPVNLDLIDKVRIYAHALGHAHAVSTVAVQRPRELPQVYRFCMQARALLRSDAANLALHGIVNAEALVRLSGEIGHRNVGYDLLSLVAIHRTAKVTSQGRTAVLPEALERAEAAASRLLDMVARRQTQLRGRTEAAHQRRRAFTLLVQAYAEAQQAVGFLRWKQRDADRFTPSLFSAKGAGRPRQRLRAETQLASDSGRNSPLGVPAGVEVVQLP